MLPDKIVVMGRELELIKCRGAKNRAYRLITEDGNTDFTFKLDNFEDPAYIVARIEETVKRYLKDY